MEQLFQKKLEEFYKDNFLNGLQRASVTSFIKKELGQKDNAKVERVRPWLLAQLNKSRIPPPTKGQKGCPDIIPGLRAKPWW